QMGRECVQLAGALTDGHKIRLANTLFGIAEIGEDDMELAELVQDLGDERLAPYLVSQLRRVADDAPGYAESLIRTIAQALNDEDLKQLADEYDNANMAERFNKSEYDGESDRRVPTPKPPHRLAPHPHLDPPPLP